MQECGLFGLQAGGLFERWWELVGVREVAFQNGGVDVALAADGGGVAELSGYGLDGFDYVLFELGGVVAGFAGGEE